MSYKPLGVGPLMPSKSTFTTILFCLLLWFMAMFPILSSCISLIPSSLTFLLHFFFGFGVHSSLYFLFYLKLIQLCLSYPIHLTFSYSPYFYSYLWCLFQNTSIFWALAADFRAGQCLPIILVTLSTTESDD